MCTSGSDISYLIPQTNCEDAKKPGKKHTLGAPVMEPPGKAAAMQSVAPRPSLLTPLTVETI